MTPADTAELVAMLSAAYPNSKIPEATCRVYESMLADLDRESAHRAVSRLMATSKWLPTIAEIRSAAVDLRLGAQRLGGEAWGDVSAAVRRFGRGQSPTFDDPIVAECVRQMGWLSICNSTNDAADRARFIEMYNGLAARARLDVVAGDALALPSARKTREIDLWEMGLIRSVSEKLGGQK